MWSFEWDLEEWFQKMDLATYETQISVQSRLIVPTLKLVYPPSPTWQAQMVEVRGEITSKIDSAT